MNRHVVLLTAVAMGTSVIWGQRPGSLKNVRVPQPSNLTQYVRDPATFEEMLTRKGADGSRAHTLTDACAIP